MTTYEQRELAGVSLINEQPLPTDYNAGERKDEAHALALDEKKIRLLDNPMIEYKQGDITETLWNPRDRIMEQLKSWKYRNISTEEANHIPFKYAS